MVPLIVTIPHSGEDVPLEVHWLQNLKEEVLMCDVDRYVDQLYRPILSKLQIPHVVTRWHRYVVDLNRFSDDVDEDSVCGHKNPSGTYSKGLHWVYTTKGVRLMPTPIPVEFHNALIEKYYEAFHLEIASKCKGLNAKTIYHIDAHSMPSVGTRAHADPGETRAEVVISDLHGKSCDPRFRDLVVKAYSESGLQVRMNWPYVGGRITERYGQPSQGHHTIQVELRRNLYMNEGTLKLNIEKKS
jgi:N-formylglutamate deformylase